MMSSFTSSTDSPFPRGAGGWRRSSAPSPWPRVLAASALGASPERLASQITDDVGALSGGAGSVKQALDDLQATSNVQLWVWFTDTTGSIIGARLRDPDRRG